MALDIKTNVIDGLEVRSAKLSATRALALFTRVAKVMVAMADADKGQAAALAAALAQIEGDEAPKLASEILVSTSVVKDGRLIELNSQAMIDHVFTGNLPALFKVIMFAIEVNFGNFLDATKLGGVAEQPKVSP